MTDLIQRLADGPGSRELSKEVLTALGHAWSRSGYWLNTKTSRALYTQGGEIVRSPTESVDDALALVPEGLTYAMDTRHGAVVYLEQQVLTDYGQGFQVVAEAKAQGDNPLPRAICIAVLRAKG